MSSIVTVGVSPVYMSELGLKVNFAGIAAVTSFLPSKIQALSLSKLNR